MNVAPNPNLLLSFCITAAVIVIVPGPSVMFVVGRALAVGRPAAIAAATGDALGQALQGLLAVFGVGAIVAESELMYNVIKFGGAIYLVVLGASTLRHRQLGRALESTGTTTRRRAELQKGFLVGASNPKTIVFFVAALPQFVDHSQGNVAAQMLVLLFIYSVLGWTAEALYGVAGGSVRQWSASAPRRIERLIAGGGLSIVGVGAWLALSHGVG